MRPIADWKRSERLRAIGSLVLACGFVSALVVYGIKARSADLALDDTNALGYARSMRHGMGEMMGSFGSILTDWQQAVSSPIGEALVVMICAALLAGYFFRVAWVLDEEERDGIG